MKAILRNAQDIDRGLWHTLLMHSPQAAIYLQPDYLDIVAPGWQAIEVWRDQSLLAVMPLHLKQKAGYTYALQPSFCQYWGIAFAAGDFGSAAKTYHHRRKVVKAVVEAIPAAIKWFLFGFAPEFDYPHPFHWAGYRLSTRYTYRLDLTEGFADVEQGFDSDLRNDIRKATRSGLVVQVRSSGEGLMELVEANAAVGKQLLTVAESKTLEKLIAFLLSAHLGRILEVKDAEGKLLGAALLGSFARKTSYLMSAQLPGNAHRGCMGLLLSQAIASACGTDQLFDFEGSMIEGIEGFFRGFGGHPVPYLMIEKNGLPLPIRWIRKLR